MTPIEYRKAFFDIVAKYPEAAESITIAYAMQMELETLNADFSGWQEINVKEFMDCIQADYESDSSYEESSYC